MMKRNNFPFSAVLGLNHAKTAILIVLVNPRAGGLLISGPRGIGKSTADRKNCIPELLMKRIKVCSI